MNRSQIIIIGIFCIVLSENAVAKIQGGLSIGIFPRHNYTETIRMFSPISKHLAKILDLPVQLYTAKNISMFWDDVKQNKYDLVHLNQFQYLTAHKNLNYKIMLMNEEYGKPTLRSIILVRKDSGINNISDLKGKNITFAGDNTAMISYLIPRNMLLNANITNNDYETTFALNPPNAFMAVVLKQADACGVGDALLNFSETRNRMSTDKIRVIAQSDPIAHLAWATSPSLTTKIRDRIQETLLRLKDSAKGRSILSQAKLSGFKKAKHIDYVPLKKYMRGIK